MAEDIEQEDVVEEEGAESEPSLGLLSNGLVKKVAAMGFVLLLIGLEALLVSMYIPSSEVTVEMVQAAVQRGEIDVELEEVAPEADEEEAPRTREVPMGSFDIITTNQAAAVNRSVRFRLTGAVDTEKVAEFTEKYTLNEDRLRDQILGIIRQADASDLEDGLGLIRRQILTTVNRVLGKPYLQSVYFPEFEHQET
jgi:flagellar basal body-associated protein FliL